MSRSKMDNDETLSFAPLLFVKRIKFIPIKKSPLYNDYTADSLTFQRNRATRDEILTPFG